jgi:hypothetical protein|tara:strand:+ start:4483 stop:4608 length:126 start_codon:yes stop_codon:yes gene_type:complete
LAILAAGIGLPAETACESWKSKETEKKNLPSRRQKACGFFI